MVISMNSLEKMKFKMPDENATLVYSDSLEKDNLVSLLESNYKVINSEPLFLNLTVKEYLERSNFDFKYIPFLNIKNILNKPLITLGLSDNLFIKCLVELSNCKFIVFDNVTNYINHDRKSSLLNELYKKNIKYLNITFEIEESKYNNYLILFSNNMVAIEGNTKSVLLEEKLLRRLGFSIPICFDLSMQLKSYNLIDEIYTDVDELVEDLWI